MTELLITDIIKKIKGPVLPDDIAEQTWSEIKAYEGSDVMMERICAASMLESIGPNAIPDVMDLLQDRNPMVRIIMEDVIRDIGPDAAITAPLLIENTKDKHREVVVSALNALGKIGPAALASAKRLCQIIKDEETAIQIRALAIWAVGKIGPDARVNCPDLENTLIGLAKHTDRSMRLSALAALNAMQCAAPAYKSVLNELLLHQDYMTARRAAELLGINEEKWPVQPEWFKEHPYSGTARRDFLIACLVPGATDGNGVPNPLFLAFIDNEMCNCLSFWPDHRGYAGDIPTGAEMKRLGMAALWYFFTEDIFNAMTQRNLGFKSVADYDAYMCRQITRMAKDMGNIPCLWSVGHEHFDAAHYWGYRLNKQLVKPGFTDRKGGYDFYRRWITTDAHKHHWNLEYGNYRPYKFYEGWDVGEPSTWEFLNNKQIAADPCRMTAGGVSPQNAHPAFEILPQIEYYWWECQIVGTSLPIGAAYVRGAARQYGKKWIMDVSPWSLTTSMPKYDENGKRKGGTPESHQLRSWLYGYLCGADCVLEEAALSSHFYKAGDEYKPTQAGLAAKRYAKFCFDTLQDRGEPYTPVALLLEHEHGFEPCPHTNFRGKGAWFFLDMTKDEHEIEQFWRKIYPDHSDMPDKNRQNEMEYDEEKEPKCHHGGNTADMYDVLTDRCTVSALARYPLLVSLGGLKLEGETADKLTAYLRNGGTAVINASNLQRCAAFAGIKAGAVEPATYRETCFSAYRLDTGEAEILMKDDEGNPLLCKKKIGEGTLYLFACDRCITDGEKPEYISFVFDFICSLAKQFYPLEVTTIAGEKPQFLLNRTSDGWLVTVGCHYKIGWKGTLRQKGAGTAKKVAEMWADDDFTYLNENGDLVINAAVPRFDYRVYKILL